MSHRDDDAMNAFDSSPFRAEWTTTGHATEEAVYAWLDSALNASDSEAVERHVQTCDKCSAAVAEARGFIAASMRILNAADLSPRNTQRNVVSSEAVARTAATIIALAGNDDSNHGNANKQTRAQPGTSARSWYQRTVLQAAAALLVMVAGTYAALRDGQPPKAANSAGAAVSRSDIPVPVQAASEIAPKAVIAPKTAEDQRAGAVVKAKPSGDVDKRKASRAAAINATKKEVASTPPMLPPLVIQATTPVTESRKSTFAVSVVTLADTTQRTITGTVVDHATSKPLAAVNISIPGTTKVAMTDTAGKYVLNDVPSYVPGLLVRRLGYAAATIRLDSAARADGVANASLDASRVMLSDLVVTSISEGKTAPCIVATSEASGSATPIVGRFSARMETPTSYNATLLGWPAPSEETQLTLTMDALRTLRGSVNVGNDRLEIRLTPQGDNWSGYLREVRNGNSRTVTIDYKTDKTKTVCQE